MSRSKKLITLKCNCCGDGFETFARNAEYCKKEKCQEFKVLNQRRNVSRLRKIKGKGNEHGLKYCTEGCGTRTKNYFGICDTCRNVILTSVNYDFYQCMIV